ncbi:hypothetical protein KBY29_21635 [Ruegeria pomeroyi]|nr:hypothetical protein [Ruegeria pomeroyi]
MLISFTPMRRDDRLELVKQGDVLTINGEEFDFSALPERAVLPRDAVSCDWLASDVERVGGVIHLTLILPHGADATPERLFPAPVEAGDGTVPLPGAPADEMEA